ncbi:hypothetical protein SAMN05216167_11511 [Spirosoma endophyticum]|uniref:Uncharacterized protein n=1 Tax=Spirosoma endophyticum TaxID=662367 RepID=A0A1I2B6V6_9BACT|nr:hypothetical protein SAMN05216167_11511 [Spirosoma endophyticum]
MHLSVKQLKTLFIFKPIDVILNMNNVFNCPRYIVALLKKNPKEGVVDGYSWST